MSNDMRTVVQSIDVMLTEATLPYLVPYTTLSRTGFREFLRFRSHIKRQFRYSRPSMDTAQTPVPFQGHSAHIGAPAGWGTKG